MDGQGFARISPATVTGFEGEEWDADSEGKICVYPRPKFFGLSLASAKSVQILKIRENPCPLFYASSQTGGAASTPCFWKMASISWRSSRLSVQERPPTLASTSAGVRKPISPTLMAGFDSTH